MKDVEKYLQQLYPITRVSYEQRLDTVRKALRLLGDPQDTIPAIHIAGTSGKGSTAYYAAAILKEAGYTVGLAVSPHVNTVRERSQVNGTPLPPATYRQLFSHFVRILEDHAITLSYIEFLVVFTYWLFGTLNLDYMVVEVGVGGRLDPSNTITRQQTVRVITDIGLDHTDILGDTTSKIAKEKAGIIHEGDIVLMHPQEAHIVRAIRGATRAHNASLRLPQSSTGSQLLPPFQQRNWTLAAAAVEARLEADGQPAAPQGALQASLETNIPGRFEQLTYRHTTVILDAAHNLQKFTALIESLTATYTNRPLYFVVALGENKSSQREAILQPVTQVATNIIATTFTASTPKQALTPTEIVRVIRTLRPDLQIVADDDPYRAVDRAVDAAHQNNGVVVVTGSFYLIDGIRSRLVGPREAA